jgi:hypothetical protein
MNLRRVFTGIVMFLLIILLIAPTYFLKDFSNNSANNTVADELSAIAKSMAGDTTSDKLAAKAVKRATRSVVNGKERFRIASNGSCWEIEPTSSDQAYRC